MAHLDALFESADRPRSRMATEFLGTEGAGEKGLLRVTLVGKRVDQTSVWGLITVSIEDQEVTCCQQQFAKRRACGSNARRSYPRLTGAASSDQQTVWLAPQ